MLRGFGAGDVMKHQWPFSYLPLLGCESNRREISEYGRVGLPPSPPPHFLSAHFFLELPWVFRRLISCLCKAGDYEGRRLKFSVGC